MKGASETPHELEISLVVLVIISSEHIYVHTYRTSIHSCPTVLISNVRRYIDTYVRRCEFSLGVVIVTDVRLKTLYNDDGLLV